ncbi:MAG: PQQ-dependent sugar dehydrogenase [Methylophilaceae bacterium]|nr:PQQ-dependent sugar dehydrogenase [Methylophilaceae bacterium]
MRATIWQTLFAFLGLVSAAWADVAPVIPVPAHPEAALRLPSGFRLQVFARLEPAGNAYFRGPRFMTFGPEGDLYLSLGFDNKVVRLPDRDRDGRADQIVTVADRLNAPQGLAFVEGRLLVANQDGVVRLDNGRVIPLITGLPAGGHTLKTLRLGPDGHLYLNVGSSCNVCRETDPRRATLLRYTVEGKPAGGLGDGSPIWAIGLRNSQGFAWHPRTGAMFATNNGADMRSARKGGQPDDDLPPEHLNLIEPGKHYGWPDCWGDRVPDPNVPGDKAVCASMQPPAITFPAHSTPIGITFLDKSGFPAAYREDALVALHGSWNRERPSGYKVVRVRFEQGRPVEVSDFVTGWLQDTGAWGRPVDVTVGPDGAVYVSDDRAGMIYRITYTGGSR